MVPEHIFLAGLGGLFNVMTAGNVVSAHIRGSAEYGALYLGAKVILVLGHTDCGAITATINGVRDGDIASITDEISRAIGDEQDTYKAEVLNINNSISRLLESRIIRKLVSQKKALVIGAIYDTHSGVVDWL